MIFRVFDKEELKKFFDTLAANNTVVGPVETGIDRNGRPLYAFEQVSDFQKIRLHYTTTKLPAKRYFLPFRETLASFRIDDGDWHKTVDFNIDRPYVFFGLHACDINALNKLDKVLMGNIYPMPYYAAKRKNMFIIGIDCLPQPFCFCRSMGSDTALHGFDLFITDIGDRYFIEILSATAYNLLQTVTTRAPEEDDHLRYMKVVAEKNKKFTAHVDTTDLTKILDMEFQSPRSGNSGAISAWAAERAPMSAPPATATALRRRWTSIFGEREKSKPSTPATSWILPRWLAATISGPNGISASNTATTTSIVDLSKRTRNRSASGAAAAVRPVLPGSLSPR